jgi:excisionase family DNA binding protein
MGPVNRRIGNLHARLDDLEAVAHRHPEDEVEVGEDEEDDDDQGRHLRLLRLPAPVSTLPVEAPVLEHSTPETMAAGSARDALRQPTAEVIVRVGGREVQVPAAAVAALEETLVELADGHSVRVLRMDREVTTQEAADILNLSRPHFVRLLEQGKVPFHMVGTHHRVLLDDVLAYRLARRKREEEGLQILTDEAQKHNLGY